MQAEIIPEREAESLKRLVERQANPEPSPQNQCEPHLTC